MDQGRWGDLGECNWVQEEEVVVSGMRRVGSGNTRLKGHRGETGKGKWASEESAAHGRSYRGWP